MDEIKKGIYMPVPCTASRFAVNAAPLSLPGAEIHMARFLHRSRSPISCNANRCWLAFYWIIGILAGVWISVFSGFNCSSLMRSVPYGAVSIVSLVLIVFLPFLLSAIVVFFSCRVILFLIVFVKGCLMALVSMGVVYSYGGVGWFIRGFLCFSDMASLPLLYWYWMHILEMEGFSALRTGLCLLGPVYCIGSIDFCLIMPFLADCINL